MTVKKPDASSGPQRHQGMIRLLTSRRIVLLFAAFFLSLHLLGWIDRRLHGLSFPFKFLPSRHTAQHTDIKKPHGSPYSPQLIAFWDEFSMTLAASAPPVPLPNKSVEALINNYANIGKSFSYRQDLIELSDRHVEALRDSHSLYVEKAKGLALKLPYGKGSQGIVVTASGSYMPQLIVSLRMLRKAGSTLPLQVFLESNAVYEPEICENILPNLNARCYILEDILGAVSMQVTITKYQLKPFALLFSTFDDVLVLDADNLAVQAPEDFMKAEPYTSTGLVTWPDYWANTASPKFYDIASVPVPSVGDRAASESGQILFSKSKHATTLLLITYYNFHGPSHYYKLLSQGAVGQGDKETYLAAAIALNTTFYSVQQNIRQLGFRPQGEKAAEMGKYQGAVSIQHDPRDDADASVTKTRPAFLHSHMYKLNAAEAPGWFYKEMNGRMYGSAEKVKEMVFGRDVEMEIWGELLWTGCTLEKSFQAWKEMTGVCERIADVYHFLFGRGG